MRKTERTENFAIDQNASKRTSSKQIEAKVTTVTLILGAIVLNVLWWAGIQFMKTENNREITLNVQPVEQRITQADYNK